MSVFGNCVEAVVEAVMLKLSQIESAPYSCLNVKEPLARNRRDILCLSDSNGIRTHNHLVCKRTLNHLAKLDE